MVMYAVPFVTAVLGVNGQGVFDSLYDHLLSYEYDLTKTVSGENKNIASLGRRLQQIQYEIDIATGKWEKATAELDKVVGAAGGEQDG